MVRPLLRNAISCSRRRTVSTLYSAVSKMPGSAQNVMVVPVRVVGAPLFSLPGTERVYCWSQWKPSVSISTSSRVESALTTETPTPCRPPETA